MILKKLSTLLSLILFLLSTRVFCEESCPQTLKEWKLWKEAVVSEIFQNEYRSGIVPAYLTLENCKKEMTQLGSKKKCFDNLSNFVKRYSKRHIPGYSLGLDISDSEYLETWKEVLFPELPNFFVSNELLENVSGIGSFNDENIIENIAANGPPGTFSFIYFSNHIPSVDDAKSRWRLFVFIPTKSVDFFMQYSLTLDKTKKEASTISLVAIKKSKNNRPTVYFNDLVRKKVEKKFEVKERITVNGRLENCFDCHKSPLIPIIPSFDKFNWKASAVSLSKANQIMSSYSNAVFPYLNPTDFGPPMGDSSIEGNSLCNNDQSKLNQIYCIECHNGYDRGILNFPSGLDLQLPTNSNLVRSFVEVFELMPPDNFEKKDYMYKCLVGQYYGLYSGLKNGSFNRWLLQESCYKEESN